MFTEAKIKKLKIQLVFLHMPKEAATWPYAGYDYKEEIDKIVKRLKIKYPDIDFVAIEVQSKSEAKNLVEKAKDIDGFLVFLLGLWTGASDVIVRSGKPTIIVSNLYGGGGEFLFEFAKLKREGFPVVGTCTDLNQKFEEVIEAIRLFKVRKQLSDSKIVIVREKEVKPQAIIGNIIETLGGIFGRKSCYLDIEETASKIKEIFGTEVIEVSASEFISVLENVDEQEAKKYADEWISKAIRVVEPTYEEIVESARGYLASREIIKKYKADAITIDCLWLIYSGRLPIYPCLAFFQLNNEGLTGVCEADLASVITQLTIRYLTGQPAFVSDPVVDLNNSRIVYVHCMATNRVFGPNGPENPYVIRSHSEDRKGVSIQSLMPLGEEVTTVQIDPIRKVMTIHQGKTVANIDEEKACRTKLAVETNVERILMNWNEKAKPGWHRVTVYGNWKKQLINIASLMGLKIFEEDH